MPNQDSSKAQIFDPKDVEMDMTPMIDVTFLLLIFFMCTLKFKTLEGRLSAYLPSSGVNSSELVETLEPIDVGIHVRVAGTKLTPGGLPWSAASGQRFVYGADRKVDYSIGPRRGLDLAGLRTQLESLGATAAERGVVLFAGEGTVQGEAVGALDLLIDVGVDQVRIKGAR